MSGRPPSTLPPADWYELRPAGSGKPATYTCPFCRQYLPASVEHVLVSPLGDRSRRRHAHMACVREARAAGTLPTREDWQAAQPREPGRLRGWRRRREQH